MTYDAKAQVALDLAWTLLLELTPAAIKPEKGREILTTIAESAKNRGHDDEARRAWELLIWYNHQFPDGGD